MEIPSLDRATPIYVDVNLSGGDCGKAVSKRLHEMGFTELFLCTGMTAAEVGSLPWIKGIRDKKAPWAGSA
ncbi:MAG: hypothetical protein HYW49_01715 [Deltaproteobacteria bacterium]|nr:hypothetical protein [Deltaproteobacteria bacterium]